VTLQAEAVTLKCKVNWAFTCLVLYYDCDLLHCTWHIQNST